LKNILYEVPFFLFFQKEADGVGMYEFTWLRGT